MKLIIYSLTLLLILLIYSCEEESADFCLSNQQSVQAGFYSGNTSNDTTVSDVVIFSEGVDIILYDTVRVNELYLPLSMHKDTSRFIIEINALKDTVSFVHQKELNFVSGDCGFVFNFYIDTVMYSGLSLIDTVLIDNNSIIYNENFENVKIYLF